MKGDEFTEYALQRSDGTMNIRSSGGTEHLHRAEQWQDHQALVPAYFGPGRGHRGLGGGADQRVIGRGTTPAELAPFSSSEALT
jgi:hypothetical protein